MPCCFGAGRCSCYSSVNSSNSSSSRCSWWEIEKAEKVGKKTFFLYEFRRDVRQFFGAILWPVRPSVPCCFGAGRCSCYSSVSSSSSSNSSSRWADGRLKKRKILGKRHFFSRKSEGTLGSFSVRFWGLFVLPCLAVLVLGGALATLLLAAAAAAGGLMEDWKSGKSWEKGIFSRNSEGTLSSFSVRFYGLFVLPCLAVLVPGGALASSSS